MSNPHEMNGRLRLPLLIVVALAFALLYFAIATAPIPQDRPITGSRIAACDRGLRTHGNVPSNAPSC
jgi:predicted membrane protein